MDLQATLYGATREGVRKLEPSTRHEPSRLDALVQRPHKVAPRNTVTVQEQEEVARGPALHGCAPALAGSHGPAAKH